MSSNNAHTFALYLPDISGKESLQINDRDLVHRISRVLRLQSGERLIFFNNQYHVDAQIIEVTNRSITVKLNERKKNDKRVPHVTFLLPLLKREALAHAVYGLVEVGVSSIQLVTTQKTQRAWAGSKEAERLERIIIAAAEQSKNFAFPTLHAPISIEQALDALAVSSKKYFCDPDGIQISQLVDRAEPVDPIVLAIGPEGDLTLDEKELLVSHSFEKIRLTPTVLRAETAAFLAAGIVRSLINSGK